jgi:uncharacterized protein (DUF2236 family)
MHNTDRKESARALLHAPREKLFDAITTVADVFAEPIRDDLRRALRRTLGIPQEDPPLALDPKDAYLDPNGSAWRIHSDLPSMMAGGLAALLLQTLHPLAMAGVAEHSNYKEDPYGRLERTANFVATTTYGTTEEANAAISRVKRIHTRVKGIAPDGRPYSASDPDLVTFVHVAEMYTFYRGSVRFSPRPPSPNEADRYFAETSKTAHALGAEFVPTTLRGVEDYFAKLQPTLTFSTQAREARDFLLAGIGSTPLERTVHALVIAGALCVLPPFARRLLEVEGRHRVERFTLAPWLVPLGAALRWGVAPAISTQSPSAQK